MAFDTSCTDSAGSMNFTSAADALYFSPQAKAIANGGFVTVSTHVWSMVP
jgi:hypothetical protein